MLISTALKPKKLMRIEISEKCNLNCIFCCWKRNEQTARKQTAFPTVSIESIKFIAEVMTELDCHRFHLTGGEPLMINSNALINLISFFSSNAQVDEFWITSNGTLLNECLIKQMRQAGLRTLVISIGAEMNEKYLNYTNGCFTLDDILTKIKLAIASNIYVKVHIPLNSQGISNYQEMLVLMDKLRTAGVKEAHYFKLHKTLENFKLFDILVIDPQIITEGFANDDSWNLIQDENNRNCFLKNGIRAVIPPDKTVSVSKNCQKTKCGDFCQGIYGCYLIIKGNEMGIRSCHRNFPDKRNEFVIPKEVLENRDKKKLKKILTAVWKYAYEK